MKEEAPISSPSPNMKPIPRVGLGWLGFFFLFLCFCHLDLVLALVLIFVIGCFSFFVCLEFHIIRFVISTFTPIFFIEISFVLLLPPDHQTALLLPTAEKPRPQSTVKKVSAAVISVRGYLECGACWHIHSPMPPLSVMLVFHFWIDNSIHTFQPQRTLRWSPELIRLTLLVRRWLLLLPVSVRSRRVPNGVGSFLDCSLLTHDSVRLEPKKPLSSQHSP